MSSINSSPMFTFNLLWIILHQSHDEIQQFRLFRDLGKEPWIYFNKLYLEGVEKNLVTNLLDARSCYECK